MNRAERRHRTEKVMDRRNRHWKLLMACEPRKPGQSRKMSPWDCGRAQCQVCSRETRAKAKYADWENR